MVESHRVDIGRLSGGQVDHALPDALKPPLHLFGVQCLAGLGQASSEEDVALLVQFGVPQLVLLQRNGGGGNQHRADDADSSAERQSVGRVMTHSGPSFA